MSEPASARHGVVGLGDSLMTGYGLAIGGVTAQSWAAWLAWALDDCCTLHAVNGVAADAVLRDQLPLLRDRYRLACGGIGANDLVGFDEARFATVVADLLHGLQAHADVVALATLPLQLRTSELSDRQAVSRITAVNRVIRERTRQAGAVLVDVEQALQAPLRVSPDGRHPTSLGTLEVARAAAVALDAAGLRFARHLPDPAAVQVSPADRALHDGAPQPRSGALTAVTGWRRDRAARR